MSNSSYFLAPLNVLHILCIISGTIIGSNNIIIIRTHAALPNVYSDILNLPVGFNLSFSSFVDTENNTAAVEAYGYGGYITGNIFFPILGSPAFYNDSGDAPGFSLGLLYTTSTRPYCSFLAICGGVSPKNATRSSTSIQIYPQWDESDGLITVYSLNGSFAVPIWVANWEAPLLNVFREISLVVVQVPSGTTNDANNVTTTSLQLRNDVNDTVVWNVSNVGSMRILDNGTLQIYSQSHELVQQLGPTAAEPSDTLFSNHRLTVGNELRSNGSDMYSSYSARVTAQGLGSYSGYVEPTVPFLFLPFDLQFGTADPLGQSYSSANTSSCTDASIYIPSSEFGMFLDPGANCRAADTAYTTNTASITSALFIANVDSDPQGDYLYKFITLESDGRLYITGVLENTDTARGLYVTDRQTLDSFQVATRSTNGGWNITRIGTIKACINITRSCKRDTTGRQDRELAAASSTGYYYSLYSLYSLVGEAQSSIWGPTCDLPVSCGPLSVCNAFSTNQYELCTCPFLITVNSLGDDTQQQLMPMNLTNPSIKGCKRFQALPNCTIDNSTSSDYVDHIVFGKLNHTTCIFTFSGPSSAELLYYNITGTPDDCKNACRVDCLCQGFLFTYDKEESSDHNNHINEGRCHLISHDFQGSFILLDDNIHYSTFNQRTNKSISVARYSTFLKFMSSSKLITSTTIIESQKSSKRTIIIISATVSTSVMLLIVGLATSYLLLNSKKSNSRLRAILGTLLRPREQAAAAELEMELQEVLPSLLTRFNYEDLLEATKSFTTLLGSGGCGSVYKGQLADGREVAVKVLESSVLTKDQSKQFLAELACVGRTSHNNVVLLIGFCWEYSQRLLVYEYVEGGSLDKWIFHNTQNFDTYHVLDWGTRYGIAIGIAKGLHYLHEECTQPILHFDIKPQNILLSGNQKVSKLADFGLSKLMQRNDISHVVTNIRGTPGYIAPEWLSHGSVSKKSDIYSFGMVLLELVGGRRNIEMSFMQSKDQQLEEQWYFPYWVAQKCEQGSMFEIVDKRLNGSFNEKQAKTLIFTAFWCIDINPKIRPNIKTVLQWLEGTSLVLTPNLYNIDVATFQSQIVKPTHDLLTFAENMDSPINNASSLVQTNFSNSNTQGYTSSTSSQTKTPHSN